MEYNVSHLLKSAVGTTREYDLDPGQDLALDDEIVARVDGGHVRFDRTNTGILVRGHADTTVGLTCARCLDSVDAKLRTDFTEEFEPTVDVTTGRPLPPSENDLAFEINQQHILDLGEAVRQNLIAALPIQPLCQSDCAGLCPVCGANHNTDRCDCVVADENHPLAALADLIKEGA